MSPEEVKAVLEASIEQAQVEVAIEGSHVHVTVISPAFEGLNPVKKQQLVYGALQEAIASGVIHAVHMKTHTPAEWEALNP